MIIEQKIHMGSVRGIWSGQTSIGLTETFQVSTYLN